MRDADLDPILGLIDVEAQRPESARAHPYGLLGMEGSYPLTHQVIDRVVEVRAPGNFALGYQDGATFLVFFVGSSDSDVRAALHAWVDAPSPCARMAPSAQAPWSTRAFGSLALAAPALAAAGAEIDGTYTRFAFSYARSAEKAFEKECRNYEDFGGARGLDNGAHPAERRLRAVEPFRLHAVRTCAGHAIPGRHTRG